MKELKIKQSGYKEIKINQPTYEAEQEMTSAEKVMSENDYNTIQAIYAALNTGDVDTAKDLFEVFESCVTGQLSEEDYDALMRQCQECAEELY